MAVQQNTKKGSSQKVGRGKRKGADTKLSAYVRGKITFEQYRKGN